MQTKTLFFIGTTRIAVLKNTFLVGNNPWADNRTVKMEEKLRCLQWNFEVNDAIGTFRHRNVYWNLQTWWRLLEPSDVVTSIGTFRHRDVYWSLQISLRLVQLSEIVVSIGTFKRRVATFIASFRRCDVYWNLQTSWCLVDTSNVVTSIGTFSRRDVY